jgi:hypothetical protein
VFIEDGFRSVNYWVLFLAPMFGQYGLKVTIAFVLSGPFLILIAWIYYEHNTLFKQFLPIFKWMAFTVPVYLALLTISAFGLDVLTSASANGHNYHIAVHRSYDLFNDYYAVYECDQWNWVYERKHQQQDIDEYYRMRNGKPEPQTSIIVDELTNAVIFRIDEETFYTLEVGA